MKHIFRLFTVTLALLCLAILPAAAASAQDNGERAEYSRIMGELVKIKEQPTVEVMLKAALLRQGTRYVAGTLEVEPEQLVVKLKETDCILYVESCLALALTAQSSDTSYAAFCDNIRKLRYRDGKIDGYPSRIHYTSEWILQAEKNGYLEEQLALQRANAGSSGLTTESYVLEIIKMNRHKKSAPLSVEDTVRKHFHGDY